MEKDYARIKTGGTYNGWTNRATWLAKLHLDNTSKEVHETAVAIAVEANTLRQFTPKVRMLLLDTQANREEGYYASDVNYRELWDAYRIT